MAFTPYDPTQPHPNALQGSQTATEPPQQGAGLAVPQSSGFRPYTPPGTATTTKPAPKGMPSIQPVKDNSKEGFFNSRPWLKTALQAVTGPIGILSNEERRGEMKGALQELASLPQRAASFGQSIGQMGRDALGMEGGVMPKAERTGLMVPKTEAEKRGATVENFAEILTPTGAAAGAAKVAGFLPKVVKAGRTALKEGFEQGTKAGLQTGDAENALETGALTAAVPLLGSTKRLIQASPIAKAVEAMTGKVSAKLVNSVIKPISKEFDFGKNPGLGVAKEGIVANSFEELGEKVAQKKQEIGAKIGSAVSKFDGKVTMRIDEALKPIDDAIEEAVKMGPEGQALLTRLENMKQGLTGIFGSVDGKIQQIGSKIPNLSPSQVLKLKTEVGDMAAWTGQAFDKQVNQARVKVYGKLKEALNKAVPGLEKLNERYANLVGASNAVARTASIKERQNILGLYDYAGGGAALAFMANGDYESAAKVLVGAGLRKGLGSVAAKTRMAKFLSGIEPEEKKALIRSSAAFAAFLKGLGINEMETE